MLFTWTPVPGTTSPDPVPFEQVTDAHMPSASRAEMWVVEPSRLAAARVVERLGELLGAQRVRRLGGLDQLGHPALGAGALERRERLGDQDPAR